MQAYTILAFTENSPGVLQRISILFTRRKLNIDSLTVSETIQPGVSRFTIVVHADKELVTKVAKQLARIFEVMEVSVHRQEDVCAREVALFELSPTYDQRPELNRLLRDVSARIICDAPKRVVVEAVGNEEDISYLTRLFKPYRVLQSVRSGRIALVFRDQQMPETSLRILNSEATNGPAEVTGLAQVANL